MQEDKLIVVSIAAVAESVARETVWLTSGAKLVSCVVGVVVGDDYSVGQATVGRKWTCLQHSLVSILVV